MLEGIVASERGDWHDLLSVTDLLIDGPFDAELVDFTRPWVGSSNQRYHFLTERYRDLASSLPQIRNRVEIRIGKDGAVLVNGMASADNLREIAMSGSAHYTEPPVL